VLNAIIPDSAAVADYEKFDINKYDNFYAGMDKFIDEPQGDKVWSLGYGKASVLPADFGTKKYAKGVATVASMDSLASDAGLKLQSNDCIR